MMSVHITTNTNMRQNTFQVKAIICLFFGFSCVWTCHCLTTSPCNRNDGGCPQGCQPGWYGPGCHIGNLALGKPALQSSTYQIFVAELAVDGVTPQQGNHSLEHCSHTVESTTEPIWWYVNISERDNFVIRNITLVNREGANRVHLRRFYILYTSDVTSLPNPKTWNICTYKDLYQDHKVSMYTCREGVVVGRRVAIYMENNAQYHEKLTLCEVYVDGYAYSGAGDFSDIGLSAQTTCDSISVQLQELNERWFSDMLCVDYFVNSSRGTHFGREKRISSKANNYKARFAVSLDTTYSVWARPLTCWPMLHSCSEFFSQDIRNSCFVGKTSAILLTKTEKLLYKLERQGNVVKITQLNVNCDPRRNITVLCTDNVSNHSTKLLHQSDGTLCCLKENANYTCYVEDLQPDGTVVRIAHSLGSDSQKSAKQSESSITTTWVIVLVIIVIAAAIIATLFAWRKYKLRKQRNEVGSMSSRQKQVVTIVPRKLEDTGESIYGNTVGMSIQEFERYSSNTEAIHNAFLDIRALENHSCQAGLDNAQKNRFNNILPYDFNRLILRNGTNDYINASQIHGFNGKVKYIASQGPKSNTVDDFWRMVWQEDACAIVMLTDYEEQCKRKCEQYFPRLSDDGSGVTVAIKSESTYDTHTISILSVHFEQQIRYIYHCHFLSWPDKSIPEHSGHLLLFQVKVREIVSAHKANQSSIIVHCSAGVGRTGAFIALDYLLDRFIAEKCVDVSSCVAALRNQRTNMVQTKEQYLFLHQVLLYGMKTLHFLRPSVGIYQYDNGSSMHIESCINEEWKVLQMVSKGTRHDATCFTACLPHNLQKNRHPDILPSESKRPILPGVGITTNCYINAVFCNGCYANESFIATQWPLHETLSEFWELVYQMNPGCILVLHRCPSPKEFPEIYPSPGGSFSAGALTVTTVSCQMQPVDFGCEYEVSLRHQKKTTVTTEDTLVRIMEINMFDLSREVPKDLQRTGETIMQLQTACKMSKERPIIVVCKDGATYCGLFLAAVNSLHRLLETDQAQVFHTVDLLRTSRPQFITSLEQYRYLHQLVGFHANANSEICKQRQGR